MNEPFHSKYRPALFKDMIGQEAAAKFLHARIQSGFPNCCVFVGESGVGKTTAAYICARKLKAELKEVNCASARGIDTIREIQQNMLTYPLHGESKLYLLDEFHQVTSVAQEACMKTFEKVYPNLYFILCTTELQKLIKAIRTRVIKVHFASLSNEQLKTLLRTVAAKEGKEVSEKVAQRIIEVSEGSARMAIQNLDKVLTFEDEKDQLATIGGLEEENYPKALCKALIDFKPWSDVREILRKCEGDPEELRHGILKYASTTLMTNPKPGAMARAAKVIDYFRDESSEAGMPGLQSFCYLACQDKRS